MGATLRTIKMVEETLRELDWPVKMSALKRALPRQVQHDTLKEVLEYLVEKQHIMMVPDGIIVTHNPDPAFQKMVAEAVPWEDFRKEFAELDKERATIRLHGRRVQRKGKKRSPKISR